MIALDSLLEERGELVRHERILRMMGETKHTCQLWKMD